MNGPYAEEYGAGGPSDDGVAMGVWLAFWRAEGAREAVAVEIRDRQPGGVLAALLEPVTAPLGRWGR